MRFEPNKTIPTDVDCPDFLDRAQNLGYVSAGRVERIRNITRHLGPMVTGGFVGLSVGLMTHFGLEAAETPVYQPTQQQVVPGPEHSGGGFAPRILEHPEPTQPPQTHEISLHIR